MLILDAGAFIAAEHGSKSVAAPRTSLTRP